LGIGLQFCLEVLVGCRHCFYLFGR
jgi:hypothetical protein